MPPGALPPTTVARKTTSRPANVGALKLVNLPPPGSLSPVPAIAMRQPPRAKNTPSRPGPRTAWNATRLPAAAGASKLRKVPPTRVRVSSPPAARRRLPPAPGRRRRGVPLVPARATNTTWQPPPTAGVPNSRYAPPPGACSPTRATILGPPLRATIPLEPPTPVSEVSNATQLPATLARARSASELPKRSTSRPVRPTRSPPCTSARALPRPVPNRASAERPPARLAPNTTRSPPAAGGSSSAYFPPRAPGWSSAATRRTRPGPSTTKRPSCRPRKTPVSALSRTLASTKRKPRPRSFASPSTAKRSTRPARSRTSPGAPSGSVARTRTLPSSASATSRSRTSLPTAVGSPTATTAPSGPAAAATNPPAHGAPVPAEEAVRPARDGPAEGDRPRARHADHAETREGAARRRERARARHLAEAPVGVGHEDARRAVVEHGGEREPAPAAERHVAAEASEAAPARRRLPDLGDRPDAPPAALGDRGPAADEEGPEGEAITPAERGSVDACDRPPEHDVARADQMREGLARAGEDRGARADEGRPAAVVERDLGEARERKAERRAVPDSHQHARRRVRRPRRQHQAEEDPGCTAHGARARRKPDATRAPHRPPRQVPVPVLACGDRATPQRPSVLRPEVPDQLRQAVERRSAIDPALAPAPAAADHGHVAQLGQARERIPEGDHRVALGLVHLAEEEAGLELALHALHERALHDRPLLLRRRGAGHDQVGLAEVLEDAGGGADDGVVERGPVPHQRARLAVVREPAPDLGRQRLALRERELPAVEVEPPANVRAQP